MSRKIAFIDRDGTIVKEPEDFQVDRLDKIEFVEDVFWAMRELARAGYELVMVSNQDGLGTVSFPREDFEICHNFIIKNLATQGIEFAAVEICPHLPGDGCACRKPAVGLVKKYLTDLDRKNSFVIGDRASDLSLAENMGLPGFQLGENTTWKAVIEKLLDGPRVGRCTRRTKETDIAVEVRLDDKGAADIQTGHGFFDHMLEQIARHSGVSVSIRCAGDLHIDEHHTVEDVALALGQALNEALGERRGIERYGFLLPMDEALASVALDLGGRPYFVFSGNFPRQEVGGLSTEMVPHFFRSLTDPLRAALNMKVEGENTHHMVEACFKGFARALKGAVRQTGTGIPSTKGMLV